MKKYIDALDALGFENVTKSFQKKRGNYMFQSTKNGERFGVYGKTGYIRTMTNTQFAYGTCYQINPKKGRDVKYGERTIRIYERVLYPGNPEKLFQLLIKFIAKNR